MTPTEQPITIGVRTGRERVLGLMLAHAFLPRLTHTTEIRIWHHNGRPTRVEADRLAVPPGGDTNDAVRDGWLWGETYALTYPDGFPSDPHVEVTGRRIANVGTAGL